MEIPDQGGVTAHQIFDVINGTQANPTDLTSAVGEKWTLDDERAVYILSPSVVESQLRKILLFDSVADVWTYLAGVHEEKLETNKVEIL